MKILHIITRWLRGGAEEKTLLELEHLAGQHEFVVASGPSTDPRSVERLRRLDVPHIVIPALTHYAPWTAPRAVAQLRDVMRVGRYDLVHTHSTEAGILGREAARRHGVPRIVHSIHGMEFSNAHPWLIRRAVVALHRRLAPATDLFFSNADILTRRFLAAGIGRPEQFVLVRSAVGGKDDGASRVRLVGRPSVLTAARLDRGKGIEEVLEAVARLRPTRSSIGLSVAGDGPRRKALERIARRLDLDDAVEFLGHRSDLPGLLRSADLFAFASHREGTPRVVTEAMAAGCPIVATDVDGIPEQVIDGETGWLVPPGDARALAAAMEEALAHPTLASKRADAGRRRAAMFGLDAMVSQLRSAYAVLAAKPS